MQSDPIHDCVYFANLSPKKHHSRAAGRGSAQEYHNNPKKRLSCIAGVSKVFLYLNNLVRARNYSKILAPKFIIQRGYNLAIKDVNIHI